MLYYLGEITYRNRYQPTPFYPPYILDNTAQNYDKMVYITMSDYVFNSMLYSAFKVSSMQMFQKIFQKL